jgi:hypothetical protein
VEDATIGLQQALLQSESEKQALYNELALRSGVAERLAAEVARRREDTVASQAAFRERDEAVELCSLLRLEVEQLRTQAVHMDKENSVTPGKRPKRHQERGGLSPQVQRQGVAAAQ